MKTGYVKAIRLDRDFGFIAVIGGGDCYFHRRVLQDDLEFGPQLLNQRVEIEIGFERRDGKPFATAVRPAKD